MIWFQDSFILGDFAWCSGSLDLLEGDTQFRFEEPKDILCNNWSPVACIFNALWGKVPQLNILHGFDLRNWMRIRQCQGHSHPSAPSVKVSTLTSSLSGLPVTALVGCPVSTKDESKAQIPERVMAMSASNLV